MFSVVLDFADKPRMHRHPNQNADDIGAMLCVASLFKVEINTTGVPKYRIDGWDEMCIVSPFVVVRVPPFGAQFSN